MTAAHDHHRATCGAAASQLCQIWRCALRQVAPEDLDNLRESLEHYLEAATDPDFFEARPSA